MPKDTVSPTKSAAAAATPYEKPAAEASASASTSTSVSSVPTPFTMNFGKNKGTLLSALDSRGVKWMIREKVYLKRPDLKAALLEHGYMKEDGSYGAAKPTPKPAAPKPARVKGPPPGWVLPDKPDEYSMDDGGSWITTYQALKRYRVRAIDPRQGGERSGGADGLTLTWLSGSLVLGGIS